MEPIEITVDGVYYIAMPRADGSFDILRGGNLLGNIFADNGINTELIWKSGDLMSDELAQRIGEAIERQEK